MTLHLTTSENLNLITGYGTDFIEINKQRVTQNVLVLADSVHAAWHVGKFEDLSEKSFENILTFKPEVVLLGTGEAHHFLHPKHFQHLTAANIALECMTTAAACRTYNILMSEGRNVAAALLI